MTKVRRYRNPNQRLNRWAYLFIAPFIIGFLIFSLYPMISSIIISFQNEDNYDKIQNFTTFSNYSMILTDPYVSRRFYHSFINTFIIFGMNFIPQIIAALFFATIFSSKRIRMKGKGFFQFIYFLPNILTASSVSVIFMILFSKYDSNSGGPIFNLLVSMGMDPMDPSNNLLNNPWTTRIIIAFIQFWMWFGNSMLVYIAGIKGISDEIFEAAELDGASHTRVFFDITLPILKPIMIYSLITSIIGGLQMFDIPYLMTGGEFQAPYPFYGLNGTETVSIFIYKEMIELGNLGVASAASVILFLFSLSLSIVLYSTIFKEKNYKKRIERRMLKYGNGSAT